MTVHHADIVVIGAGIAGASLASRVPAGQRVVLLEQEAQPGYHATGRSAALVSETYGSPVVRALSRATVPFLRDPPAGFAEAPLLRRCGVLFLAREDQRDRLEELARQPDVEGITERVDAASAGELLPILRPDYLVAGLLEAGAAEIDVHALHHGFLREVRANGGQLFTDAVATGIRRVGDQWQVETAKGTFSAPLLVNAAGAWADEVARMAGARPIGIQPLRRTAAIVDGVADGNMEHWPMAVDIDEEFYFKPDAGRILISPADETPMQPCDVQPDEYDLAVAVDRVEQATTLQIRRIQNKWAGLRSFAPDRNLVIGFDPEAEGFFWLAGQGGYGIQTSYGAAQLAAKLLLGATRPSPYAEAEVDADAVSPRRFAKSA